MKHKTFIAIFCGMLVGAVAFAAPSQASTTVYGHDAARAAYVYLEYTPWTISAQVCDVKADGHHAHAVVEHSVNGGAWTTAAVGDEYDGNGTCTFFYGISVDCSMSQRFRAWALAYEGSTPVGTRGYSPIVTMC